MTHGNVGLDGRNMRVGDENHENVLSHCGTLARLSLQTGHTVGIAVQSLEPGTTLIVHTRHSEYRLVVMEGSNLDVIVNGGKLLREPTRVRLEGATAGGSALRIGWVELGFRMEMSVNRRRIITSPVRSVTIEGGFSAGNMYTQPPGLNASEHSA